MINLRNARETAGLNRSNGCGSETAERFPYHVAFIGCGVEDATHEVQWLLIQVRGRKVAGIINAGCRSPHGSLNSLYAVQRRQLPYIRYTVCVAPFIP